MKLRYMIFCATAFALVIGACKRQQAPVAARPSRSSATAPVAPASDPLLEKRKAELSEVPPLVDGKLYTAPDGELWTKYPNGLMIHQLSHVDGYAPQLGQKVALAYKAYLPDRFSPIETLDADHPLIFEFGSRKQLKGLNQGISNMHKNERYKIYIPADLAYGEAGNPELGIGPNQPLIYEVKMVSIFGEGVGPLVPEFDKPVPMGPNLPETKPAETKPAEAAPAATKP